MKKLCVVIPQFGQFEYTAGAARSAVGTSTSDIAIDALVVDDGSPAWRDPMPSVLAPVFNELTDRTHLIRFAKNRGLTHGWNVGLRWARDRGYDYVCVTNSDVLFTPGWFAPLAWALDHGAALVGPMTNAPGHQPKQQVARHLPDYRITDAPEYLAEVAARLAAKNPEVMTALRVNGFCMAAKTATWWANAHTPDTVFDPKHKMTKNEDELQGRWKKRGLVSAMVPASFVFHYRGVTRTGATKGQEGKGWFRRAKKKR